MQSQKILREAIENSLYGYRNNWNFYFLRYHPDKNSNPGAALQVHSSYIFFGDTPQFMEINNAFEVLYNPQKRKIYDENRGRPPMNPTLWFEWYVWILDGVYLGALYSGSNMLYFNYLRY